MKSIQSGFTLVELMISLVITSILMAGIGHTYLGGRQSFRIQAAQSHMLEDARYIVDVMGKEVRRAGYLRNRLLKDEDDIFLAQDAFSNGGGAMAQGEFIKGEDDDTYIDRLVLRYQLHDNGELSSGALNFNNSPCTRDIGLDEGEDPATQQHIVTIHFYIEANILKCLARRDRLTPTVGNSTSSVKSLLSNVIALRILYGEDTDATEDYQANRYLDRSQVTDWEKIVSLQLGLIIQSDEKGLLKRPTETIKINGQYEFEPVNANEKRLYRTINTTFALRNRSASS